MGKNETIVMTTSAPTTFLGAMEIDMSYLSSPRRCRYAP
jgi:hypothetical protein